MVELSKDTQDAAELDSEAADYVSEAIPYYEEGQIRITVELGGSGTEAKSDLEGRRSMRERKRGEAKDRLQLR